MLDDVDIVRANPAAAVEIEPLMAAFNDAEGIEWRPKTMMPALERLLADERIGAVLVARERESNAVVGYGIAAFGYDIEFSGRDAFITELFVSSAFRRRGLGRALMSALIDGMRERGARAVHLMVRPENESARALYESRGFHVVPRLLMTKPLDPIS